MFGLYDNLISNERIIVSLIIKHFKLFFAKKPKGVVPFAFPDARKLHAKYTNINKKNLS